MKLPLFLILIPAAAFAEVKPQAAPRFRDAATHEQLAKALKRADQNDPMKAMRPVEGADPSKANQPVNLLEQSDIICFGGMATLVPKRAILATPAGHKERLVMQPGARIVGWSEFYAQNRGWITTVEVSRVQAEGNKPMAEETVEKIGKSRNLVVATFSGGPISVLPLKQPEAQTQTVKTAP